MSILSKADIYKLQVMHDTGLDHLATGSAHVDMIETLGAMRAALEAWWAYTYASGPNRALLQAAIELTQAAGINWPEEGTK